MFHQKCYWELYFVTTPLYNTVTTHGRHVTVMVFIQQLVQDKNKENIKAVQN